MNLKFLIIIILIFESTNGNEDELFGDKSIIRKLRNELGSFKSEIKFIDNTNDVIDLNEQYTFQYKNGEIQKLEHLKYIHFDDFNELHIIGSKYCMSYDELESIDKIQWNLQKYAPDQLIKIPSEFRLMGPSHFLFSLIDNYDQNEDNIKCANLVNEKMEIRCDILWKNRTKIEYYFKDDNQLKMYPIKIKTFEKESNNDTEFKLYAQIEYTKFDYSFNGDHFNISLNLPVGLGCRSWLNKNVKIETDFGRRFKLEYDFEFDYLDLKNKDNETFLKRKYNGKWFRDGDYKFNIIDGIDEETNQHLRTYYDSDSEIAYDIIDNKCIKNNLKEEFNYTLNWFYFQDIILFPQLFNINNIKEQKIIDFIYLGDHKLDDDDEITYKTFEKIVIFDDYIIDLDIKKGRKNMNNIRPIGFLATHYYDPLNNKIPKQVELRLVDIEHKLIGLIKIKINQYYLASSSEDFNEEINMKNCFKNLEPVDYRELHVKFKDNSYSIELLNHNYIKYEFRKSIGKYYSSYLISPLRIADIKLDINYDSISLNCKLIDPLNSLEYFNSNNGLELDEKKKLKYFQKIEIIENISHELCSRYCIENFCCISYSFNENTICKLWIDYNLNSDVNTYDKYDLKEMNIKSSNKNSILGRKLIKKFYFREHYSINNTINYIKNLIDQKLFFLFLKRTNNYKDSIKLDLIGSYIESEKSRKIKNEKKNNKIDQIKEDNKSIKYIGILIIIILLIAIMYGNNKYKKKLIYKSNNHIIKFKNSN